MQPKKPYTSERQPITQVALEEFDEERMETLAGPAFDSASGEAPRWQRIQDYNFSGTLIFLVFFWGGDLGGGKGWLHFDEP